MPDLPEIEMQELLDLARNKSVNGRTRLVQVVGYLFFEETASTNERERELMAAILQQLIHDVKQSVRKALADRLAVENFPPRFGVHSRLRRHRRCA